MNVLSRSALAAGLFLAVFGTTNIAYGGFEKFFITGNPANCQGVFDALEAQHPIDFPTATFFGPVEIEIPVSPLANGSFNDTELNGGIAVVTISGVTDQRNFDWTETTMPSLEGIDAVSIKAGNGRTVYVYTPEATSGANLSDVNTTKKITEVLFCADNIAPVFGGGPFCKLTVETVTNFCATLGPLAVVSIGVPGNASSQTCVCSGVIADACNAAPIGDDGGVCDPTDDVCDPDCPTARENCCFISPFCNADNSAENPGDDITTREDCPVMDISALPAGLLRIQTVGSCCTITDNPLAGGGDIAGGRFCYENFGFACAPGFELQ